MKNFLLFLSSIFLVTSCTINENVTVSEQGEIEYVQRIEIPQVAAMMGALSDEDKIQFNQISNSEHNYLDFIMSLQSFGETKTTSEMEKYMLYKEELHAIDFIKFRLDLRDNFAFEIINRSKSADDFNQKNTIIEEVFDQIKLKENARVEAELAAETPKQRKKRLKKGEEIESIFGDNPLSGLSSMSYAYDGKTFKKNIDAVKYLKGASMDETFKTEEEKAMMNSMLKQMKFKTKYTFPRKIKSVNVQDAMLTADGKSFVVEYTLEQILNRPEITDFEVILED
ncbi:hypothetical protein [Faecalibacter sp. LW9]|uniref:hypothetical protein n=1 Tax=Faecalibacter sp. LW9 TaxID=3103144 RepID=UPI002AFFDBE5|nr:hypothetical protein [Faecalibacter sp. LW9]